MKRTEEHSIEFKLESHKIDITLYDFTEILLSFHIETIHKIWMRVEKNEDGCIGDLKNLKLLIHCLFCLAIRKHNPVATYPPMTHPEYVLFLTSIVDTLFNHYVKRTIRNRELLDYNECIINGNKSHSPLVVGFEDVVDKLAPWLLNCDQLLQHKRNASNRPNLSNANRNKY